MKVIKIILFYGSAIIIGSCIGVGLTKIFIEPFLPKSGKELVIEQQKGTIAWQDSLICTQREYIETLLITKIELENTVKLLELNKANLSHAEAK